MKNIRWLLGTALFLAVLAVSFMAPWQHAALAFSSPTLTWNDYADIGVSGGSLAHGSTLSMANQTLPSASQNFGGYLYVNETSGSTYTCKLPVIFRVNGNNSGGTFSATLTTSIGGQSGTPTCANQSSYTPYNNLTVNIGGTRPPASTQTETPAQQAVTATFLSPDPQSSSPATITMTITDSKGKQVSGSPFTLQAKVDKPGFTPDQAPIAYTTPTLELPPDTYKFCINPSIGGYTCDTQQKQQYVPLDEVFGESFNTQSVDFEIDGSYIIPDLTQNYTFGPLTVTLTQKNPPSGQSPQVYTQKSTSQTWAPTQATQGSNGGATVTTVLGLKGTLTGVAPGTYSACVTDVNVCQDYTKVAGVSSNNDQPIVFNLTPDQIAQISGAGNGDVQVPPCQQNGDPLTWFICPLFNDLAGMADWMLDDIISPLLASNSIGIQANGGTFKIWSNFRVYGDIILVIVLLIAVLGQAIGGGLVDAYTFRKTLPRVLLAAILINISIYIVALCVDLSNVVGASVGSLLITPIKDSAQFTFTPNGLQIAGLAAGGSAALVGTFFLAFMKAQVVKKALIAILILVVLPAVMALLGAFVTIILLHALIIVLTVVSPVAFGLYALPNTERYFKLWWDWLYRALLIYPIVMLIFAISDIMTVFTEQANGLHGPLLQTAPTTLAAPIVAFILQFLPLFLITFAFKLAGGLVHQIHEFAGGTGKRLSEGILGNPNDPNSLRNSVRHDLHDAYDTARHQRYSEFRDAAKMDSGNGKFKRRFYRQAAKIASYGNLEGRIAASNEAAAKRIQSQVGNGPDDSARAFWAEYDQASGKWLSPYADAAGNRKEWSPADVDMARKNARDGNLSVVQAMATYEFDKAADDGKLADFKGAFLRRANEMGWTAEQANGVWAGVKFANKNSRLEQKYTAVDTDPNTGQLRFNSQRRHSVTGEELNYGDVNHVDYSTELADKTRQYDFSNFRPSTAKAAKEGYTEAADYLEDYNDANSRTGDRQRAQAIQGRIQAGNATAEDRTELARIQKKVADSTVTKKNYERLATSLEDNVYSRGRGFGGEDENGMPMASGGTGGSAESNAAWQDFMNTVQTRNPNSRRNTPSGGGNGGGGGGGSGRPPRGPGPGPGSGPGGGRPPRGGGPSGPGRGSGGGGRYYGGGVNPPTTTAPWTPPDNP